MLDILSFTSLHRFTLYSQIIIGLFPLIVLLVKRKKFNLEIIWVSFPKNSYDLK